MLRSQNPGFPRTRKPNPYDGQGCYAPNSSTPPWGWFLTLLIAIAVCGLLFFGPTLAARTIGA